MSRSIKSPRPAQSAGPSKHNIAKAVPECRLRIVFTESQIRRRIAQMASQVNRDYRNRTLHLIGLVENSLIFLADFTRLLRVPLVCHFLCAAVRDRDWHGLPLREITFGPKAPIEGKDVLLVHGVLQTGVPMDFLLDSIQEQKPRSLRSAALIEKTGKRKVGLAPDYVGFRTRQKFLVGYGLGLNGQYLNLPYIADLEEVNRHGTTLAVP